MTTEDSFSIFKWVIKETKSHILKLEGNEREEYENKLKYPMYPDMIFDKNSISISHKISNCRYYFNTLEALKMLESVKPDIQVAAADVWQEANAHILKSNIVDNKSSYDKNDFDWTYTTKYIGTLEGKWKIEKCSNIINYEILKKREKILFFSTVCLYEDELGDNGCAQCQVRIRVMESGFFLLHRFFLRVDGRKIRCFDTRVCCGAAVESENITGDFMIREVRWKESSIWKDNMAGITSDDAESVCDVTISEYCEKLTPIE